MLASNKNLISKTSVLANSISDHDHIVASLNLKKPRPKPTYISTRSFKNFKKDAFLANISSAPWSLIDIVEDTEDKLVTFNSLFYQILDQRAPVKIIKQRARPNSFINDNIRSLTRTRDYWQWLARQTNDPAIWSGYRNFKGEVKREIRLSQREFVEEQIIKTLTMLEVSGKQSDREFQKSQRILRVLLKTIKQLQMISTGFWARLGNLRWKRPNLQENSIICPRKFHVLRKSFLLTPWNVLKLKVLLI